MGILSGARNRGVARPVAVVKRKRTSAVSCRSLFVFASRRLPAATSCIQFELLGPKARDFSSDWRPPDSETGFEAAKNKLGPILRAGHSIRFLGFGFRCQPRRPSRSFMASRPVSGKTSDAEKRTNVRFPRLWSGLYDNLSIWSTIFLQCKTFIRAAIFGRNPSFFIVEHQRHPHQGLNSAHELDQCAG